MLSSFDLRFSGSRNLGEGERVGGFPSERERALEGDRELLRRCPLSVAPSVAPSNSILASKFSLSWLLNMILGLTMSELL